MAVGGLFAEAELLPIDRSSEAGRTLGAELSFGSDVEKSELLRTIEKACLVFNEVVRFNPSA
jgi:hypothetical protein